MTVVMLVLSMALPLYNFGFWSYMAIIGGVLISMSVAMYFFDNRNKESQKEEIKVKKSKAPAKKEATKSDNAHVNTGYFTHNYN